MRYGGNDAPSPVWHIQLSHMSPCVQFLHHGNVLCFSPFRLLQQPVLQLHVQDHSVPRYYLLKLQPWRKSACCCIFPSNSTLSLLSAYLFTNISVYVIIFHQVNHQCLLRQLTDICSFLAATRVFCTRFLRRYLLNNSPAGILFLRLYGNLNPGYCFGEIFLVFKVPLPGDHNPLCLW